MKKGRNASTSAIWGQQHQHGGCRASRIEQYFRMLTTYYTCPSTGRSERKCLMNFSVQVLLMNNDDNDDDDDDGDQRDGDDSNEDDENH